MTPSIDEPDDGAPPGWTAEESSDDVSAWLGPDERVLCVREGDGWIAYAQPRSELGTVHRVPLLDEPAERERAVAAARQYVEESAEDADAE
ncbi:hypothetical protein [Halegenticoccus tardaugens]|uniref:hypothetical protein n=1 Tax=Halegenticoccus tardaugens TaxID=2071624 RepID=UPI00100B33E0|nr:hypothetical protein [Halegenticoccus tardaugens]